MNALLTANTNPNSGIDGLGEYIDHADINKHKPSSQDMHCKPLDATGSKQGECQGDKPDDDEDVKLPTTKGAYICGKIQGVCCPMTIDTAATYTVVSARVYYKIPKDKQPCLRQPGTAKQAGDGVVEILGKAIFDVEMGRHGNKHNRGKNKVKVKKWLAIGHIRDDVLLGDDILREDIFGPADIMYSKGVLRFRGKRISIRTVDSNQGASLKVVSIDTEVVPGMTEKIVDGFLERPTTQIREGDEQCMLVEADPGFSERYKVLLAPVIVDCAGKVSVAVRVCNPFQDVVVIPGNVVMGSLEPVEVAGVLKEHECEGRRSAEKCTGDADVRVRRIQLYPPSMDWMSDGLRAGKATGKGPTVVDPTPLLDQVNGSGKGKLPHGGPTDM